MTENSTGDTSKMNEDTAKVVEDSEGSTNDVDSEEIRAHLLKMTDYKTYAKGLMDIALLTANANQLRYALELSSPYSSLLITLFSLSILLQVVASALLFVERMTCKKKNYQLCHRLNMTIGILVIFVIVINILGTAFGAPPPS